ncbi:hypothetical protein Ancab_014815 [Ancistrocladus abbreviatus]
MSKNSSQPLNLELTIISAQGMKNTSETLFISHRLRTFVTVTTFPPQGQQPASCKAIDGDSKLHVYRTKIDEGGSLDPTWGDKFHIPLHPTFFKYRYSCIYLHLYTKRLMWGKTQLGWCQIPAAEIFNLLSPAGLVHHLSYRLRARDGTRGHGIVNVAVKLTGAVIVPGCPSQRLLNSGVKPKLKPEMETCQTAIGIPATICSAKGHGPQGQRFSTIQNV